jgi:tripartite-type tricarboxylate transporter receptor subunit TctC
VSISSERRKSRVETPPIVSKSRPTPRRRAEAAMLHGHPFRVNATKLLRRRFLHLAASVATLPAVSRIAWAQTYPARPVRMIVPVAPGSVLDSVARLIAQKLSENVGKRFYIENIVGAGGNIGMGRAAQGMPDGYTVLVVTLNYVANPALYDKVPYDPLKSFEPVALAASTNVLLTVNPSVPARTVDDLIALVRATPGKYSYASGGGIGSPGHLVGEQFRLSLGLDLVHVPFNGANLAVGSVVAGHTPIGFVAPTPAVSLIKDGKLRALAGTGMTRLQALPDVPTMAEAGYPGIECDTWNGLVVPAGTPRQIITTLNRETVKIIALPEIRERLTALGLDPIGSTPDEFALRIKTDIETWGKVIRAANIKAQ